MQSAMNACNLKAALLDAARLGADVDSLLDASRRGDAAAVAAISGRGVDVNTQNEDGDTALHIAALFKKFDCLKTLLRAGADVHAQNNRGETALHCAAINTLVGGVECLKVLLGAGADLDMQNSMGWTALHVASLYKRVGVVTYLVQSGAAMDVQNQSGWTALSEAKIYYDRTCVEVLTSPSMRRENVLARATRFAVFDDFYDASVLGTVGLYFEDASKLLYESLFERVLLAVHSRLSLSECRLVCKELRRCCDCTLAVRPVEFFAPASALV
jgi:uncharacterized protein